MLLKELFVLCPCQSLGRLSLWWDECFEFAYAGFRRDGASAAPCRFVNDTLQPVVAIALHRNALASARISRLLSQTSNLPSAQTLQLDVFILGIDSECMHGKELFKYLSLT